MAEVTGTIGSESVELKNAATESTLRAMLAALNKQTSSIANQTSAINKMASGSGGGAGAASIAQATKQQTTAVNQSTQATTQASKGMSGLAKGAMLVGGVLGDLASGAIKTVGNLTDFAGQLMDGSGSISGFYSSLKDLPLGMGLVAGLFGKIAEMQEAELRSYRDLSKAGVNFGGSLNTIRMNALELGMTMDQYTGVIKKNQAAMSMLGGNTNTGAEAFTKMAKQLRESPMGAQLRGMGVDAEDAANGLASYVKMTGARSKEELKNTGAIAQAAGNYMKNLDALSQLTGESKEALEAKMAEEAQESQFQAYLSTLDEKGREKALAGLQESLARGGKGAAAAFKDQVQGLPPMTEAGQQFVAQSRAGGKAVSDLANNVKDSTKTVEDQKKAGDKLTYGMAQEAKAMGVANAAISRAGGAAGEVANAQAKAMATVAATGAKTEDEMTAKRKEVEKSQEALGKSAAARAAETEKAMKDMGAAIYGALQPAIQALTPIINKLAFEFMGFVKDNMPAIKQALTDFVHFMEKFVKNLFSDAGREKIVNDAVYYLKLMWISIKEGLPAILGGGKENADKEREAMKQEKEGYDKRAEAARTQMENAKALDAYDLALHKEKYKALQENIKSTASEIKKAEEEKENNKNWTTEQQKALEEKQLSLAKMKQRESAAQSKELVDQGRAATDLINKQKTEAATADQNAKETRTGPLPPDPTSADLNGSTLPGADKGGIFKGPESGFPVMLHGHEAVIPMENLNAVGKSVLPDFASKMPAIPQLGQQSTPQPATSTADSKPTSMFDDIAAKLGGAGQSLASSLNGSSGNEILVKEIQQLNKQTAEMVKFMRLTLDENRSQTTKLGSLSGNLYV